ncbi:MAG: molecular chaperone [Desulfuromonas sp.]|nr:MAG: molecular chaperone [Desulfuromonas sp.]
MTNWNLFREMDSLRKEMDELFRGIGNSSLETAFLPGVGTQRFPRVNLSEDGENFYLEALLPGVDEKDIELSVTGNSLTLAGERFEEKQDGTRTWHRRERGSGKFLRTIELPSDIDNKKISAEYKNGILTVTMAKAESAKPKKISIVSH